MQSPDFNNNLSVGLNLALGVLCESFRKANRIAFNPNDNCVFAKVDFVSAAVRRQIGFITDAMRLDLPSWRDLPVTDGGERELGVTA